MLWLGHLLSTRLYFGRLSLEDALWSIAPDVPMALFLSPGGAFVDPNTPWRVIKNWMSYTLCYKLPHSLWFPKFKSPADLCDAYIAGYIESHG